MCRLERLPWADEDLVTVSNLLSCREQCAQHYPARASFPRWGVKVCVSTGRWGREEQGVQVPGRGRGVTSRHQADPQPLVPSGSLRERLTQLTGRTPKGFSEAGVLASVLHADVVTPHQWVMDC